MKMGFKMLSVTFALDSLALLGMTLTADPAEFRVSSVVAYGYCVLAVLSLASAAVWCWRRAAR